MIATILRWIKGDASLDDAKVVAEFRKRHRAGIYFVMIPMVFIVAIAFLVATKKPGTEVLGDVVGILILTVFFYSLLYYRCPRCGTTPTSSKVGTTGVLLFPKKCSKCGAPLLPNHRWGQD
jgi:ribosomal protein S27AE